MTVAKLRAALKGVDGDASVLLVTWQDGEYVVLDVDDAVGGSADEHDGAIFVIHAADVSDYTHAELDA